MIHFESAGADAVAVLPAGSPQQAEQLLAELDRERRAAADRLREARDELAAAQQRYMRLVAAIATQRHQEGVLVGRGTLRG